MRTQASTHAHTHTHTHDARLNLPPVFVRRVNVVWK